MKKIIALAATVFLTFNISAQTAEELKEQQAPKKAEIAKLQGEVDALQAQIDALPGWKKGAFGTIGGSVSQFSDWFSQGTPNVSSGNIAFTVNGFANLTEEKFFWRNAANINLGWVKFDDKDNPNDDDSFRAGTDVFNITSLYGRNVAKNFAISGLAEYRTTILDNFNDPGYLDLGVGGTWTPIPNMVVVIHPLNYNFVFSNGESVFESSLGAKILVDYTRKIGAINFKTNLSAFQSYETSDLSNWTWTNSFGYTLWKKIGVGFDFGLRNNRQETVNFANNQLLALDENATPFELGDGAVDDQLQSFWTFGLSYAF